MTVTEDPPAVTVWTAFVAALGELEDLKRERSATVDTRQGGSYTYTYADLSDVLGYVRPILARHGLALTQNVETAGGEVRVSTVLVHLSGDSWASPCLTTRAPDSPQALGSAITYLRRYSALATLGLATEDDDGRAASRPARPARTRARMLPPRQAPAEDGPTPEQTRHAMALFGELDLRDRGDRLARTSQILGRVVGSWNDVSSLEASRVIDVLTGDLDGAPLSPRELADAADEAWIGDAYGDDHGT